MHYSCTRMATVGFKGRKINHLFTVLSTDRNTCRQPRQLLTAASDRRWSEAMVIFLSGKCYRTLWGLIYQDTAYQFLSKSVKYYRRIYDKKIFGVFLCSTVHTRLPYKHVIEIAEMAKGRLLALLFIGSC